MALNPFPGKTQVRIEIATNHSAWFSAEVETTDAVNSPITMAQVEAAIEKDIAPSFSKDEAIREMEFYFDADGEDEEEQE